ncbi:MAG: endonuclease/exonuclease/phosphatase family protein [Candidatus Cryptobacteroides sp.]|nr:endonuclease/exonuclease/phosphatase family protein [Bacteroidales bacterium]MDY5744123.1 endonuclease/exonuclease/phosphatase family protein [Candidatus Cryptobacteroides sp.]
MKRFASFAAVLCLALAPAALVSAAPKDYKVIYKADAEPEEGSQMAEYLVSLLGSGNAVADGEAAGGPERRIEIVNSGNMSLWEYEAYSRKGSIVIDGGGEWALRKACELLAGKLKGARVARGIAFSGSVEGEVLFDRSEGSDLRILVDNIWDYSKDTIPPAWQRLGVDCRDAVRAPQYAQMVRAYMPDVLALQEYSSHMDAEFLPRIAEWGYVHTTTGSDGNWNNTPIFYNSGKVEVVDCEFVLYTPKKWSNHGSKSFTSAVFRRKEDGKLFALINTHLWWKSEKAQPGSIQARAAQIRLILAQAQCIKAKYNCPVFVTGDMNSEEDTLPIRQFFEEGFVPCYRAATVYANMENGHHICSPGDGFSRVSRRKGADRKTGAIDHCFIWNAGDTEVKVFDCITSYFTVPLTDHYPYFIDSRL